MSARTKILVTGATGFIGSHLITWLLNRTDVEVIASSRTITSAQSKDWFSRVRYVPWTIGDPITDDLYEYFHAPDVCIHLAWDGLPDFRKEEHTTTIYENHKVFLEALISGGLPKLSAIGTCLEYGMREGALNEEMTPAPTLSYPIGKSNLHQDLISLKGQENFELDWIRLFYMYGEGQSPKSILAQLQQHLERNATVFNMSKGDQLRDYLPVTKIAEIIGKLALLPNGNGTINCCSGTPISILQLVKQYLAETKSSIDLNTGYYPYPDYEPFEFWGSTKKLDQLLSK